MSFLILLENMTRMTYMSFRLVLLLKRIKCTTFSDTQKCPADGDVSTWKEGIILGMDFKELFWHVNCPTLWMLSTFSLSVAQYYLLHPSRGPNSDQGERGWHWSLCSRQAFPLKLCPLTSVHAMLLDLDTQLVFPANEGDSEAQHTCLIVKLTRGLLRMSLVF